MHSPEYIHKFGWDAVFFQYFEQEVMVYHNIIGIYKVNKEYERLFAVQAVECQGGAGGGCMAYWQPMVAKCSVTLEVSSTTIRQAAKIELTTLDVISFRHMPLQLLRSFCFPLPLYNRARVMICH
jgi:hypothetical protein